MNFDTDALKLAVQFAGAEKVVAGSDYPHQIGSIPSMLSSLEALDVTPAEREAIRSGNAMRLLGISAKV